MLKSFKELSTIEKSQITETYINVFSSPPWNEAFICPLCKNYHGLEFAAGMSCAQGCNSPLEAAYKPESTLKSLEAEAAKPGALALAAFNGSNEPIGMSIGFPWTYEEFVQNKYPEKYQNEIADFLDKAGLRGQMFYGSDVFVSPNKQQKGTGTTLTYPWRQEAEQLGLDLFFRTNTDSGMAKIGLKTIQAQQVFGQKVDLISDSEKGTKLATYPDQVVNGRDPQSGNRILMLRPADRRRFIIGGM